MAMTHPKELVWCLVLLSKQRRRGVPQARCWARLVDYICLESALEEFSFPADEQIDIVLEGGDRRGLLGVNILGGLEAVDAEERPTHCGRLDCNSFASDV